jgi:hypothetical protein
MTMEIVSYSVHHCRQCAYDGPDEYVCSMWILSREAPGSWSLVGVNFDADMSRALVNGGCRDGRMVGVDVLPEGINPDWVFPVSDGRIEVLARDVCEQWKERINDLLYSKGVRFVYFEPVNVKAAG